MNEKLTLAILALLAAITDALKGDTHVEPKSAEPEKAAPPADAPRRGRPPKNPAPPAEEPAGPTDEERYQANRALIEPLVKNGQGDDVKKVIAKYSKSGLKDLPADKQADFEKDIEGLSY